MSRDKELEKTPVNTDKNTAKSVVKTAENTEAVAPIIPWASASSAVAEPAVESAAEVPEASATPKETVEGTTKENRCRARQACASRLL